MKNKNGFTLVELLAVIAILAILVIIALPNVLGMFNQGKKDTFVTEIQSIYDAAETQFVSDSMGNMTNFTDGIKYARVNNGTMLTDETKGYKRLDLSGTTSINYYIHFSLAGKVIEYYAYDNEFQFIYNGTGLSKENIKSKDISEATLSYVGYHLDAKDGSGNEITIGKIITPFNESGETVSEINTGVITIADADAYIPGEYYKVELSESSGECQMANSNTGTGSTSSKTYTVKFYYDDGTLYKSVNVKEGATASVSNPSKADKSNTAYAFSRWVTSKGGTKTATLTNVKSDMSVYASFNELKLFYINGQRCTFIKKISGSIDSTWGYYVDFCHNIEGYGGAANGSCPSGLYVTTYLSSGKSYVLAYPSGTTFSTSMLYTYAISKVYSSYETATTAITAGGEYGDSAWVSEKENECFTGETKVYTVNGLVNIKDIKVGDMVWSYNEKTKQNELSEVTNLIKKQAKEIYKLNINGEIIETTRNHPFYMNNKWVKVKDLNVNDKLVSFNGNKLNLNNIEVINEEKYVYNLTVDNNHTYYVGRNKILVHNKPA